MAGIRGHAGRIGGAHLKFDTSDESMIRNVQFARLMTA